jgi:hypothetical protein
VILEFDDQLEYHVLMEAMAAYNVDAHLSRTMVLARRPNATREQVARAESQVKDAIAKDAQRWG